MRIKCNKKLLFLVVLTHFTFVYYFFQLYSSFFNVNNDINKPFVQKTTPKPSIKKLSSLITVVLREFDSTENDLSTTVLSFTNLLPSASIYIAYNERPYPPLDITLTPNLSHNIKFVDLSPNLTRKVDLLADIRTRYVLFVPDSTRISSRHVLQEMVQELDQNDGNIVTVAVISHDKKASLKCINLSVNNREWTLRYSQVGGNVCDAVFGKHLILVETVLLKKLYDPFLLPFPQALYVQSSAHNVKAKTLSGLFLYEGKPILKSRHSQIRKKQADLQACKHLYSLFKIKQVIQANGMTEWYGCTKDTPRCFGPVLDSIPSYLYEKKWTPPCCMANLRKTALHVFTVLSDSGVRHWLEAGSLLGAMRSSDILPWDYNVDIGYYREDLNRCKLLKRAASKPFVDKKGFYWEKATEGNFFKVHYSKVNRIYVNLFPFYLKNGTMVKDSWFTTHKNMEFPESFLHPMASIDFIGRSVPCPNNIRDFLELKFGKGCIETPQYPDPSKIEFP